VPATLVNYEDCAEDGVYHNDGNTITISMVTARTRTADTINIAPSPTLPPPSPRKLACPKVSRRLKALLVCAAKLILTHLVDTLEFSLAILV
jgi:hypothetical protein